jgi:hypothetical protein
MLRLSIEWLGCDVGFSSYNTKFNMWILLVFSYKVKSAYIVKKCGFY